MQEKRKQLNEVFKRAAERNFGNNSRTFNQNVVSTIYEVISETDYFPEFKTEFNPERFVVYFEETRESYFIKKDKNKIQIDVISLPEVNNVEVVLNVSNRIW